MMHPEPPAPGEYVAGVFLHPNGFSTERNMVTSVMNALNLDTTDFRLRDRLIVAASPWLDRERADRDSPAQTPPAAAPAGPGDAGPDKDDAELRRLAWAASAGPWEYVHAGPDCEEPHTVMGAWYDGSRTSIAHTHWRRPNEEANFRFIAAARNALPGLLDRLADARGHRAAVIAELERLCWPPADVREAAATILREWGHLPNGSIPSELVYPLARWVAGLGRTGGASP